MAMSRALAAPAAIELRDEARLAVLGGLQRIEHGRFFDHAILNEPLRQAAEARAISTKR